MFFLILDFAILETQLEGWKPDERKKTGKNLREYPLIFQAES